MHEKENPVKASAAIPKPVFMRMLMLFASGAGCLLVGVIVSVVTRDLTLLVMSVILSIALTAKGVLLRRKMKAGQIYSTSGVCVGITPKMLGRYRRIELVDTVTGDDAHFVLPKKTVFKIGHVYICYFDNQINSRPVNINDTKGGFVNADLDLPTNGFLGFEDFGVYHEKPVLATTTTDDNKTKNNEKEQKHEEVNH